MGSFIIPLLNLAKARMCFFFCYSNLTIVMYPTVRRLWLSFAVHEGCQTETGIHDQHVPSSRGQGHIQVRALDLAERLRTETSRDHGGVVGSANPLTERRSQLQG